jgi:hypothetical protein
MMPGVPDVENSHDGRSALLTRSPAPDRDDDRGVPDDEVMGLQQRWLGPMR